MEVVVALDEAVQFGPLLLVKLLARLVEQAQHGGGRGRDADRGVAAWGQAGAAVGEHHDALGGYLLAALVEEALELGGRFVELLARRAALPVGDRPLLDEVPVVVVLIGLPAVAVDVNGGVDVLHLDGEQAARPEEQVVDLAAPVVVAVQERPVVGQGAA